MKRTASAVAAELRCIRCGAPATSAALELVDEREGWQCENEAACVTLGDFLDKKRKSIAQDPAARFAGVGAILDGAHIEAKAAVLAVTLSGTESEMARAARAVLAAAFSPRASPKARPSASGFSPSP